MAERSRRIAVLTAPKCFGKTRTAGKIVRAAGVGLIRHDYDISPALRTDFGHGRNAESTVQVWNACNPEAIGVRMRGLHTAALASIAQTNVLAEGWAYHLRSHRWSLYEALRSTGDEWEVTFIEFQLPASVAVERVIAAHYERNGTCKLANRSLERQMQEASRRLSDWNRRFEAPMPEEETVLADFKRFHSSEAGLQFLLGWFLPAAASPVIDNAENP